MKYVLMALLLFTCCISSEETEIPEEPIEPQEAPGEDISQSRGEAVQSGNRTYVSIPLEKPPFID
jgi:hypothetical protein